MKKSVALIAFVFVAGLLFSQNASITVLNSKDSSAVQDAYVSFQTMGVSEKKEKKTLLTGERGTAAIPFHDKIEVKISHLSFMEITDTLQAGESMTFYLQPLNIPVEGVVVTAQYTPDDPRNSVYPVKIIKPEAMERQGATNLKELLAHESNIRIAQDNILGSSLSMQGLSGEQIKILVDGVPVIGRVNGNIDVSQLNLNNAKRIEIIEGPVSVQYGTNALGGVVNIITDYEKGSFVKPRLNGYYESAGVYNIDAGVALGKNRHFADISGGRYFFDGYSETDTSRNQEWKPKEQYFGSMKYGYGFKRLNFTAKGDAFYEKITNRGKPRPPYFITAFDDYYYTQRYSGLLSLSGEILEDHYLDQMASFSSYSRIKNTYYKDLVSLENNLTANPDDQDTTKFYSYLVRGFVSRNKANKIFNYQVGYDISIETGKGKRIDDGEQMIGDYAFFTSFNIKPLKQFAMQAGVRWSYNTDYKAPATPSVNIKWLPLPQLIVRTSYARGFRAPSLKELYLDFTDVNHDIKGNTALEAEYSNNVSLSLDYSRITGSHTVSFFPSFFFNDVRNLITLAQSDVAEYTYVNINNYQTIGGEMRIGYKFKELHFEIGAATTGRRNEKGTAFGFSPEVSLEAGYLIPKAEVMLSVYYKYNGAMQTFIQDATGALQESSLDAYNMLDISLNRQFWKDRISLTAGMKNLLDVNNVNASGSGGFHGGSSGYSAVAWGRTFFASLKFRFEKGI